MKETAMDAPRMPCTLAHGLSLLRRGPMAAMTALAFGFPLAVILILLPSDPAVPPDASWWQAVVASLRAAAEEDPSLVHEAWFLAALLPLGALGLLGHHLARIRVTPAGLDGYLPRWLGMGLIGQTGGRWRVAWCEVRSARVEGAELAGGRRRGGRRMATLQGIKAARVIIETDRGTVRLSPFPWYERGGPDHRLGLREISAAGRVDVRDCLARSPLIRALEAQGQAPEWGGPTAAAQPLAGGYDLARHRGMLVQIALMAVAGLYALVDAFFLGQFVVLDPLPLWPFAVAGVAGALGLCPLGRGAPTTERVAVGALAVAALVAAVHPAMLRLNAWTAQPEVVTYTAVAPGRFEASPDRPAIDLSGKRLDAYWREAVGPGGRHRFTLLEGALGFRQLDLGPLYARTRAFYAGRGDAD